MPICLECQEIFEKLHAKGKCKNCYKRLGSQARIAKNPEAYKTKEKARYAKRKSEVAISGRARYEANKEKILTRNRANYHKTKTIRNLKIKKWQERNPEKTKEYAKRANQKRRQSPIKVLADRLRQAVRHALVKRNLKKTGPTLSILKVSKNELFELLNKYIKKPCVCGIYCKNSNIITAQRFHLDHIIPISKAETLEDVMRLSKLDNLQLICPPCNLKKSDKILGTL